MTLFTLPNDHFKVTAVTLQTVTDYTDDLVRPVTRVPFRGGMPAISGQIFLVEDPSAGTTKAIISYAADFQTSKVWVENFEFCADFDNSDYEILEGPSDQIREIILQRLLAFAPGKLIAMANTWGDRNGWSRVNDGFIRMEVDACKEIGLDALQIDDGWQTGSTADPARWDADNRRCFNGNFWDENAERFPQGLKSVSDYSREKGIRLGLWFAPDFHDGFALADRDIALLKEHAEKNAMNLFKLDMIHVLDAEGKAAFENYLDRLKEFSSLQLDVTNGQRLGYLGSMRKGTVFVENRYTASRNHFPYRTLRNIWTLGQYIPTQTLLGEVLNPELNTQIYTPEGVTDPCAPEHYSEDYLLAIAAFTSPLFWMETQFLSEQKRRELARLLPVWKSIRDELLQAPAIPIGEEPSGFNFSGFRCGRYALLFRDNAEATCFKFDLNSYSKAQTGSSDFCAAPPTPSAYECLAANGNVSLNPDGLFCAEEKRTYGLFRLV